jgi:hypothetical protein
MGVPEVIKIGDWCCPYGHFSSGMVQQCARCLRKEKFESAVHIFKKATDEETIEELRTFIHDMQLAENLSRPSSRVAVAVSVAATGRSVDEIIE